MHQALALEGPMVMEMQLKLDLLKYQSHPFLSQWPNTVCTCLTTTKPGYISVLLSVEILETVDSDHGSDSLLPASVGVAD